MSVMPKFFFNKNDINRGQVQLFGEDEKHIKTVLRAREGEEITLCDGEGMDYQCRIASLERGVLLDILSQDVCETEPKTKITLYQGLPKADKMELIIQKCVELGVDRIVAVSTERAIVKLDKKETKKLERWQKIAEAAAKQSGRGKIPEIGQQVLKFKEAVAEAKEIEKAREALDETNEKIKSLISRTELLYRDMNNQKNKITDFANRDYLSMGEEDKYFLGTLVNNTLSLSKLLNEVIE